MTEKQLPPLPDCISAQVELMTHRITKAVAWGNTWATVPTNMTPKLLHALKENELVVLGAEHRVTPGDGGRTASKQIVCIWGSDKDEQSLSKFLLEDAQKAKAFNDRFGRKSGTPRDSFKVL